MSYEERFEKILELRRSLETNKGKLVDCAARDLLFTVKDSAAEVDVTVDRLKMYEQAAAFLKGRKPLGGPGSRVSLMLSYNGSSWLNTAITSLYIVGNKVSVKFSSRGSDVMGLTEEMYRPIFGEDIAFYRGSGKSFVEKSVKSPDVSAVVVFGFDENVLPYEPQFRACGKKFVFEGPGQDPFIVFPDADLDLALSDLMTAKFMYSGQTCTAPKRILIHRSIYEDFLERFVDRVERLVVGDPSDPATDVTPVASDLAVRRISLQLADAARNGARILAGGTIEGNLIRPTIVRDATDDMLGMREEVFGPVAFTTSFESEEEAIGRAKRHKYGLRAAVFGGDAARRAAAALKGGDYCHPVEGYTFGKFGTVARNQTRAESWKGAFVTRAVGGYGYSGWIWETAEGRFRIKQGPKLLSLETSSGT
jgi:succinate-semialdehyde dehydrogenase/glutarate-semialdehyde dehydrogenase